MDTKLAPAEEPHAPQVLPRAEDAVVRRGRQLASPPAVALLVYALLTVLLFRAGWASPTTRNIGGPDDSLYNMWALRWTPWALANGENPLFTDHLNFPFGVNMMWNALVPVQSLLLWPITATAGVVASYNVLVTVNLALSAWCAYRAARIFVESEKAAFAAGLLYGFSPFMLAQSLDHPTLTAAYVPPLLLIVLHQILVRQSRSAVRMGVVLGALVTLQLYTAEEMLAAQALTSLFGVLILLAFHRRAAAARVRHALVATATTAAVVLATTGWALLFQFLGPQRITGGTVHDPNVFVNDLASFVVPTRVQQLSSDWSEAMSARWSGNPSEWGAYIGLPLLVALAVAVVKLRRNPMVAFAAVLAPTMAVLSLGPNLRVNGHDTGFPMPWRAVERVPLLGHILPGRLVVFVFLCAALVVAVAVERVLANESRWVRLAGGAMAVLVAASLLPSLSYPSTRATSPPFFTDGSARIIPEGTVALVAPMQQLYPAEPMLWQAEADLRYKMPQGYFFAPDDEGNPAFGAPYSTLSLLMYDIQSGRTRAPLTPGLRLRLAQDLTEREVQTVLVGPMKHRAPMVEFFESLFRQPPDEIDGVFVWQRTHRLLRTQA